MYRITLSSGELLKQACGTAEDYISAAVPAIDKRFGDGYAEEQPELISEFVATASADFHTAIIAQQTRSAIDEAANTIATAILDAAEVRVEDAL